MTPMSWCGRAASPPWSHARSVAAHRVIDARGQVVAPGFIDIHTHSDFTLPLNPRAESKIRQGVTLEVVGNCGFSVAPALPGTSAMLREYLASSATWLPFHDTTFADYAASFPSTSSTSILQVGHNTLRLMTAGLENRPLTPDEMAGDGTAAGRSAGGRRLGSLLRPLHRARATSPTPPRSMPLARVLGATAPPTPRTCATRPTRASRRCARRSRWPRPPACTCRSRTSSSRASTTGAAPPAARRDRPPPGSAGSGRLRRLSVRHRHQPVAESLAPLGDGTRHPGDARAAPQPRRRARACASEIARARAHQLRAHPVVGRRARGHLAASARERRPHAGRHRAAAAALDPIDAVADYLVADRGETRILITSMADADVHEITRAPWVTVGSDGNALATSGVTSQGKPHPRYYGTHTRVLGHYVRDLRLLTLERAVAKMTGVAARALGLADRGLLRPGAWADVVVFDPARIADLSTYEEPHRYPAGVSTVVVNGQVVVDGGDHTGALPGRVIRRAS